MTQPTDRPAACLLDACTQQCTTECREAINRTWHSLRGTQPAQPTDRPGIDQLTSDQLDQLYAERDAAQADRDGWRERANTYRDAWQSAKDRARKQHVRAEKAEATLTAAKDVEQEWRETFLSHGNVPAAHALAMVRAVLDQHGQTTS
ncbi:hypothetical protein [Streptomyces sp. NPDC058667]|uniref:hypothetical protein n=1 Tax=Streptomyces sp. NPDC058667 TaxID=3346588 RepID=UPI00365ADECF